MFGSFEGEARAEPKVGTPSPWHGGRGVAGWDQQKAKQKLYQYWGGGCLVRCSNSASLNSFVGLGPGPVRG